MTNEEADQAGSGPTKPVTATLDLYTAIEEGAVAAAAAAAAAEGIQLVFMCVCGTGSDAGLL